MSLVIGSFLTFFHYHRRAYEETRRKGKQRGRVPLRSVRGGVSVVCRALTLSAVPQTAPRLHICRTFELV
eukprot:6194467-Pleurochrysis_carterae.AAC.1